MWGIKLKINCETCGKEIIASKRGKHFCHTCKQYIKKIRARELSAIRRQKKLNKKLHPDKEV